MTFQTQSCLNAEHVLQVAPWPSRGFQLGGEQGEGPLMHPPHLLPHSVIAEGDIAEGEVTDGQAMEKLRIELAELHSKSAQQHQVRTRGDPRAQY